MRNILTLVTKFYVLCFGVILGAYLFDTGLSFETYYNKAKDSLLQVRSELTNWCSGWSVSLLISKAGYTSKLRLPPYGG